MFAYSWFSHCFLTKLAIVEVAFFYFFGSSLAGFSGQCGLTSYNYREANEVKYSQQSSYINSIIICFKLLDRILFPTPIWQYSIVL